MPGRAGRGSAARTKAQDRNQARTQGPPRCSTGNVDADAEAAYDEGYQLWNSGKYDAAITSLRAMAKKYPDQPPGKLGQ